MTDDREILPPPYRVSNGRLHVLQAAIALFAQKPAGSVSAWADAHRILPSKSASESGRWRTSRTPYLKAIMDDLSVESPVQRVVFIKSTQVGATEAGLNWLGWFIATQRAPMMCVQPTIEMAERFSKQRLTPMIDVTPTLRAIIPPARSRDSGNTTLMKDYPGGMLILSGANSSASLRSMPAKYLFLDEIDAYPLDLNGEGDPVALAEARLSTFSGRKVFLCSTPTIESLSRIQKEWVASNQQRYYVPCPHCGSKNPLNWQNLHWPEHQPEAALYECPDCRTPIAEHHKTRMLELGEWRAEHPERSIHGYHINALYTPIGLGLSWPELAAKFERVKKDPAQYKTFINTILGECFADPDEKFEADEI